MNLKGTLPYDSLVGSTTESRVTFAAVGARRRRGAKTQVERSAEMRVRVLNATLECLAAFGYSGTTFESIAKQAGVSRGALQHHYPERHFLIAGALEIWVDKFNLNLSSPLVRRTSRKRISYVLDLLWEASISLPAIAIQDVRAAARTDSQLQAMLVPLEHQARERQYVAIAEAFGKDFRLSVEHRKRIDALFATMRGLVALLGLGWEKEEIHAIWERARDDYKVAFQSLPSQASVVPSLKGRRAIKHSREQLAVIPAKRKSPPPSRKK